MKTKVGYEVFKYVTVVKSVKDGNIIFKDDNGKIYFIDRKFASGYEDIDSSCLGDRIIVWVRKELDKFGYVSVMVDDFTGPVTIDKFIDNFSKYSFYDLISIDIKDTKYKDLVFMSNYVYNNDIGFNKLMSSNDPKYLLPNGKRVVKFFEVNGIATEKDEFINDLHYAMGYLYAKFIIEG